MQLEKFNDSKKFTSLHLVDEINKFRELEGNRAVLRHDNFLAKIEDEFNEEIRALKIKASSYTTSQNKQAKMYELDYEQSLQMLMSESKTVRKGVVKVLKAQQGKINELENLSPAEFLLYHAQMLVKQEKKLQRFDDHLQKLESRTNNHDSGFYSIMGYASLLKRKITLTEAASLGKKATIICNGLSIETGTVPDPRFGKVKIYPEEVLKEIFN